MREGGGGVESDGEGGGGQRRIQSGESMLLSALLPSGIKSVYLLPVKFHHRARNVLVITSWKPIGKWFSWRGACALVRLAHHRTVRAVVFALALPPILSEGLSVSQASPVSGSRPLVAWSLSLCPPLLPGRSNAETGYTVRSMRPLNVS